MLTDPARRSMPGILQPPADPAHHPRWLAWLETQRLTPLACHWLLRTSPAADLAADVRWRLTAAYTESQAEWLQRRRETTLLLDILAAEPATPVILLKGVALAASLYPDPALRPMNDIDVLVPAGRLRETMARLLAHGYERRDRERAPGFDQAHSHDLGLVRTASTPLLGIELHNAFPWPPRQHERDMLAWCWLHTEPITFDAHRPLILDPTASLLQLSAHAILRHSRPQARLIWFQDIDLIWRQRGADIAWDELVEQARGWELEAALHVALARAVANFNTPLPPPVAVWLQRDAHTLSGYAAVRQLTSPHLTRSSEITASLSGKSPRASFHYLLHLAAPHPDHMRHRYQLPHPALLPFAYLYRWFDIAADLARTGWRYLRNLYADS